MLISNLSNDKAHARDFIPFDEAGKYLLHSGNNQRCRWKSSLIVFLCNIQYNVFSYCIDYESIFMFCTYIFSSNTPENMKEDEQKLLNLMGPIFMPSNNNVTHAILWGVLKTHYSSSTIEGFVGTRLWIFQCNTHPPPPRRQHRKKDTMMPISQWWRLSLRCCL